MARSKKFSINWRDAFHGFIMAFGGAFIDGLINVISVITTEGKTFDVAFVAKEATLIGLVSGLAYISKKFFQNSDSKFTPEPKSTLQ